jgi:hypothetical protein
MATTLITPSVKPGQALPPQSLSFTFDSSVDQVLVTTGPNAPVFSKTLGFDYGPIPGQGDNVKRPFLAVTQDGRGNVVYDAGFPKYLDYNNNYPPDVTFDGVKGGIKFLINSIKVAANRALVAVGNRKVLILANSQTGESYDIVTASSASPTKTLTLACTLAGFEPTLRNATSYGGELNPTVEELAEYVAVIFVSMTYITTPGMRRITQAGVNALHYNRTLGSGMVILTDHCLGWYTSLEDADQKMLGYPTSAQKISSPLGTWFTGDVNRANITVGELIANSGPSPLFDGIPLDQGIGAGLSESLVMVVERTGIPPADVQPINMNTDGEWLVNVLVILKDGSAAYETYRYFIVTGGDTFIGDRDGNPIPNNVYVNGCRLSQLVIKTTNPDYPNMQGIVTKNGIYMGSFNYVNGQTNTVWPGGEGESFLYKGGDVIGWEVQQPFLYNLSVTIEDPIFEAPSQPASQLKALRADFGPATGMTAYNTASATAWKYFKQPEDPATKPFWLPKQNALVERLYTGQLRPAAMYTYANDAAFQANPPTTGVAEATGVLIRDTLKVYVWRNANVAWTPLTTTIQASKDAVLLLGLGRRVRDRVTNVMYRIETDRLVTV